MWSTFKFTRLWNDSFSDRRGNWCQKNCSLLSCYWSGVNDFRYRYCDNTTAPPSHLASPRLFPNQCILRKSGMCPRESVQVLSHLFFIPRQIIPVQSVDKDNDAWLSTRRRPVCVDPTPVVQTVSGPEISVFLTKEATTTQRGLVTVRLQQLIKEFPDLGSIN